MLPFRNFLILLALMTFISGCAGRYENMSTTTDRTQNGQIRLAVLPFQTTTDAPGAGLVVADTLANQLHALGYSIIAPEAVSQLLANHEGEAMSPVKTGQLVGAPYLLTGRVTEYTYKAGVGETPALGINMRVIEAATGKILWSATLAETGRGNWFTEDSLSRLLAETCQKMVTSINSYFSSGVLQATRS